MATAKYFADIFSLTLLLLYDIIILERGRVMKKFFVIKRLNCEDGRDNEWEEYYVEVCQTLEEANAKAKLNAYEYKESYENDYEETDVVISIITNLAYGYEGYRVVCENNYALRAEIFVGEEG